MLVFSSPQPCLATGPIDPNPPMGQRPDSPHPQVGDSWSGLLTEPGYGLCVCPTPLLGYCEAASLQSGWHGI